MKKQAGKQGGTLGESSPGATSHSKIEGAQAHESTGWQIAQTHTQSGVARTPVAPSP